ncbi:MAG: methionyl-tRNA formyltransferase, partial [Bacteroidetes bacterium]
DGAELVVETVRQLAEGSLTPQPQNPAAYRHPAPKLFKEDGRLDWQQPAAALYNRIRGLSPYPAAWTTLDDQPLKLFRAERVEETIPGPPGALLADLREGTLLVACGEGALALTELQLAGKKRLPVADFLRGYKGPLDVLI